MSYNSVILKILWNYSFSFRMTILFLKAWVIYRKPTLKLTIFPWFFLILGKKINSIFIVNNWSKWHFIYVTQSTATTRSRMLELLQPDPIERGMPWPKWTSSFEGCADKSPRASAVAVGSCHFKAAVGRSVCATAVELPPPKSLLRISISHVVVVI